MQVNRLQLGLNATNCYVVHENNEGLIIDPGSKEEADRILNHIDPDKHDYRYIINTHGHFDHIGANEEISRELDIPIAIHEEDSEALVNPEINSSSMLGREIVSPKADRQLKDEDRIDLSGKSLEIYHTPGHSPGGIVIYAPSEKILFSGDTIFRGGVGRTDLPRSSGSDLKKSLLRIREIFPSDVKVYPGHGEPTDLNTFFKRVYPQIY